MFNLAIDSKLRGCDVVAIRAEVTQPWPSTNLQPRSIARLRQCS